MTTIYTNSRGRSPFFRGVTSTSDLSVLNHFLMSLKSGSAFGGPPAPVSPPLFEMRRSGLTPSQSQGTSRGYFRLFLLFSFLLFEYWSSIRSGDPRMAPLKRLRSHPPMLDPYMSTNCSASRGFAFARAPLPRADGSPRVLIWMLDDRVLSSTFPPPTDYVSVAVMHNYQYAKSKGYDFVLFRPLRKSKRLDSAGAVIDETNLLAKAFNKDEKRGINQLGCFNSKVGRWRASTWCKVLAQWALTSEDPLDATLARWDFMVFLDSDAVVADPALDVEDAFINSRNGSGHIGGKSTYGLTSGGGGGRKQFLAHPLARLSSFFQTDKFSTMRMRGTLRTSASSLRGTRRSSALSSRRGGKRNPVTTANALTLNLFMSRRFFGACRNGPCIRMPCGAACAYGTRRGRPSLKTPKEIFKTQGVGSSM